MARETELGFKIKRVLSDNDQWKKIVKETEAFYDQVESNPLEIEIGDVKRAIIQLQQGRAHWPASRQEGSGLHSDWGKSYLRLRNQRRSLHPHPARKYFL